MAKSFVQLLEAFNSNSSNSEIVEYISRANIFDMIKKSRNEMVHSRIITELISGRYYELSRKQTLIHFLDIIIKRAQQQDKNIEYAFKSSVLTRSLRIDSVNSNLEFMIKKYVSDQQKYDGNKRSDIFLDIKLAKPVDVGGVKKEKVEIIIENKVLSHESSDQTNDYFIQCSKKNADDCFRFFVFLTPTASYELDDYEHLKGKEKPNNNFIHICYQDILDYVISPLLNNDTINTRDSVILEEYVNCLELPAMPNKEDEKTEPNNRELSIMAVSKREKELLNDFWTDEDNKQLLNVVQAILREKQLYIYNKKYYTINQLVPITITDFLEKNKESNTAIIFLLNIFKRIINGKNGGTPFLVYGRKEQDLVKFINDRNLYVFRGIIHGSLSNTLQHAINCTNIANEEILEYFKNVYSPNGGGKLFIDSNNRGFVEVTNHPGLFIRAQILKEKLSTINSILENKLKVETISPIDDSHLPKVLNDGIYVKTSKRYSKISGKDIFYRNDIFDRDCIIEVINRLDTDNNIQKANMNREKGLIESFFKNQQNQNLMLSVYRILMEVETSDETKRANFTQIYKDLLKKTKRKEQN